ncbi:TetR/AcrR family transcriptional regulator [Novosphingobium sp. RL4]|uniref:TetR/AcrR family transcriptional regulator n=1 Tax=Novosphingobium sp. RL4 TaxID=3109595 RepID=UPI002D771C8B|nr:TetR/AcrR family transcriptional regulator [Novosphingobium sp. RL4]WRT94408.1 TetR/AcrR family transcriptional regulator [Novosphingobium sp. RL4]
MSTLNATVSADTTASGTPREDHRVRVAREKRERMRAHLLQSVLAVCAGKRLTGATVIEDVVRHADVSRGTFYKYFDSLDEAVIQLAFQLAEEMTQGIASVYDVLDDPVARTATGFQTFLARALIDVEWGGFLTHLGLMDGEAGLISAKVKGDIRAGVRSGAYSVLSVDLAADLLMGAKHEAIRRIVSGERDPSYIKGMTAMVLRSFGVPSDEAEVVVDQTFERLLKEAPGKLAWWRPLS